MPKVSVYLSEHQYAEAKRLGLSLSELTQSALAAEIRRRTMDDWIANVRLNRPTVKGEVDMEALMDEVRQEFGA